MERALSDAAAPRPRASRCAAVALAVSLLGMDAVAARADAPWRRGQSSAAGAVRQLPSGDVVIPFAVGAADCTDRSRLFSVTMRIYNVLAQPVGIPMLASDAGAGSAPTSTGRVLSRLMLPCGRYAAIWNGRHINTGRRLAPGVYLYDLLIDGQRVTRKLTLQG